MKKFNNTIARFSMVSMLIIVSVSSTACEEYFAFDLPETNSKVDTVLPSADFSYTPDAEDFKTIQFNDLSSESTRWMWDFGNGNTSTEQDPVFQFIDGEGVYAVTLTTSDDAGASDSKTINVVVEEVFVPITPEILNGDFNDGQNDWKFSSFTGGTTSPYNSSSDGSWINYDGSDNGSKTKGAKWTKSTSAGEWVSSNTRYAYQAIVISPNIEYILEYEYAIKDDTADDPVGGRRIVAEILDGHFDDGADAVTSSTAGPIARHVGTMANGKTSFTTVELQFTSNENGEVAIMIYAVTPVDGYIDNVKVYPVE